MAQTLGLYIFHPFPLLSVGLGADPTGSTLTLWTILKTAFNKFCKKNIPVVYMGVKLGLSPQRKNIN
jgi:hypothetical protein